MLVRQYPDIETALAEESERNSRHLRPFALSDPLAFVAPCRAGARPVSADRASANLQTGDQAMVVTPQANPDPSREVSK